jgi:hypothetical protein
MEMRVKEHVHIMFSSQVSDAAALSTYAKGFS